MRIHLTINDMVVEPCRCHSSEEHWAVKDLAAVTQGRELTAADRLNVVLIPDPDMTEIPVDTLRSWANELDEGAEHQGDNALRVVAKINEWLATHELKAGL